MNNGAVSRYQQTRCYRLGWALERTGWGLMAATVLAAVLGVFGGGWFSTVEATGTNDVSARYARFGRAHSPLDIEIEWLAQGRDATVWIERAYLTQFSVYEILPTPAAVTYHPQRIYYSFRASAAEEPVLVSFRLRAKHGGRFVGSIGLDERPALTLSHWLFP